MHVNMRWGTLEMCSLTVQIPEHMFTQLTCRATVQTPGTARLLPFTTGGSSPRVVYHHLWNENISRPHGQRNKVFVFTRDELYNPYRPQSWRRSYHHLTARHVVIPSCDARWCSLKKRKRFDGRYVSLVDSQVRRRRLMHQCQRGKRVYHDSKAHNRIHKSYIKKWPKCVCSFCSLATWIHVQVNVAELSANCCKM